jgi:hypothetical protein
MLRNRDVHRIRNGPGLSVAVPHHPYSGAFHRNPAAPRRRRGKLRHPLVWFEEFDLLADAIVREKTMKKWPRKWKHTLIEQMNPGWDDISHYLHSL